MSIVMLGRDIAMKKAVGKQCSVNALTFLRGQDLLSKDC